MGNSSQNASTSSAATGPLPSAPQAPTISEMLAIYMRENAKLEDQRDDLLVALKAVEVEANAARDAMIDDGELSGAMLVESFAAKARAAIAKAEGRA